MKNLVIILTLFVLVVPFLGALVFALPFPSIESPDNEDDLPTRSSYDFSDPFLRYMPPLQGDKPIGPLNEFEKKNSEGILERLNRRMSSFNETYLGPSLTLLDNATTSSDGLSIPNASRVNETDLYNNSTQITVTGNNNNSETHNASNTMLPKTVSPNSSNTTVSQAALPRNNTTDTPAVALDTASAPPVLSSTKPPKMPQTTSSSIIIPSFKYSPIGNTTLPPDHRRAASHPIVFLLLPFLIAGGVAVLILFGSYLRKKIRLDKLRHQLMPLYSFDPAEGEDWETELLTEPRPGGSLQPSTVTTAIKGTSSGSPVPKLCFTPETGEL